MANCPNCGNQVSEGALFCDQCGTRLPQPEVAVPEPAVAPAGGSVVCPTCGAGNVPGEAFCDYCGSPMEPPLPTVEEVPDLEPVSDEAELEGAPAVAQEPAEQVVPEGVQQSACPACNAEVVPGEAFCGNCGASLAQPPIPPEPVPEVQPEAEAAPLPEEDLPPEVAPVAPEVAVAAPVAPLLAPACPACGAELESGDAFCSTCGFAVSEAPAPKPVAEAPAPPQLAPALAGPFLVVVSSGAEIPLPAAGEILVGREDPVSGVYPDVDMTPHGGEEGGVSRRHARFIVEGGNYFLEDLDSTNFTFVNKQKVAPKTRQAVGDGDEVRFGRVTTVFKSG